jgi:hypothetical protein
MAIMIKAVIEGFDVSRFPMKARLPRIEVRNTIIIEPQTKILGS